MNSTPRIAVIGAGPGGLMCARVLQRHGIEVTVYDADASATSRNPGGTLDLHTDSGQIALEDAGLLAEFNALARPEGQAKRSLNQHGDVLGEYIPAEDETAAPEIDRGQLRVLLAESVAPGTVRWGHKLVAALPLGGGEHRLRFADGTSVEVDLVIGADGAWSRVRPLVTAAEPHYTGISFLDACYEDVESRHPRIAKLVGDGHMFASGNGRAIIGQRNSNGHVRAYVAMRTDLDWYDKAGIDLADTDAVRRFLVREFDGWAGELLPFITDTDGGFVNRAIHALPAPLTWEHTPGVTLLGDAAHVMAPFGGFGVNLAMLDGAELARALATEADVDAAVTRYEATMLPRSGPMAVGANNALDGFFSAGEPDPADIPDFKADGRKYQDNAAEYRRRRSTRSADGTWTISFKTPGGEQRNELVLGTTGDTLTGRLNGTAVENGRIQGDELSFTARLTSPFPMKITCTASIDGDSMTGIAKAAMMSVPFTGTRAAGADPSTSSTSGE
jgi:2-polyprenyl-6-methoxyphenol hydroxylase-like FAD-dependent oxidoreductase